VRALPDGALWQARAAYQAATEWAPRHSGRELALVRASGSDARLSAVRARAEASIARRRGHTAQARRHAALARSYTAMASFYQAQEAELDATMTLRRQWEQATHNTRQLAIAADTELRRRHPRQPIEPLRSAEPRITTTQHDQLNLQPGPHRYPTPDWITALAAERHAARQHLTQHTPAHHPASPHPTATWPAPRSHAILQPPKPSIQPAQTVHAQRVPGTQAEPG
jgi:hypothetical protein